MLGITRSDQFDSILKTAIEFANEESLKEYMKDHPDADPKNHSVKQDQKPSSLTPEKEDDLKSKIDKKKELLESSPALSRQHAEDSVRKHKEKGKKSRPEITDDHVKKHFDKFKLSDTTGHLSSFVNGESHDYDSKLKTLKTTEIEDGEDYGGTAQIAYHNDSGKYEVKMTPSQSKSDKDTVKSFHDSIDDAIKGYKDHLHEFNGSGNWEQYKKKKKQEFNSNLEKHDSFSLTE